MTEQKACYVFEAFSSSTVETAPPFHGNLSISNMLKFSSALLFVAMSQYGSATVSYVKSGGVNMCAGADDDVNAAVA